MSEKEYPVQIDETELANRLDPLSYDVLRNAATERPFTGEYTDTDKVGVYKCKACSAELFRSETKFHRMKEFGKALPDMRKQTQRDLSEKELDQKKVLAAAVSIMDMTGIRVGNEQYEALYGSFGLTTLHNRHAKIQGEKINFQFIGKK